MFAGGGGSGTNVEVQLGGLHITARLLQMAHPPPPVRRFKRRAVTLQDYVQAVTSPAERALFMELFPAYSSNHNTHWAAMTRAFNNKVLAAWEALAEGQTEPALLYLKQEVHLRAYANELLSLAAQQDAQRYDAARGEIPPVQAGPIPVLPDPSPSSSSLGPQGLVLPACSPAPVAPAMPAAAPLARTLAQCLTAPAASSAPWSGRSSNRACLICSEAGLPRRGAGHNCALEMILAGRNPELYLRAANKLSALRTQIARRPGWSYPPSQEQCLALRHHFERRSQPHINHKRARMADS